MSEIAIIRDTHGGCRNDAVTMQTAQKKFYDEVFFPTLREHGITRVIHAGDFFDRRRYTNNGTVRFIHDHYTAPLLKLGVKQDIILGNHDTYFRHSTDVSVVEELYRHIPESITVHAHPAEINIDGCRILLLPWMTENNHAASMLAIQNSTCPIVVGHLEIAGFSMFKGIQNYEGLDPALFDKFKLVMSGHFHHRSELGPIKYVGAPFPMTWSDYNDPRGFHIFNTETHALTFIENPHSLFQKVIYNDAGQTHDYITELVRHIAAPDSPYHHAYVKVIVKSREQPYWLDVALDALYKVDAEDIVVIDDITANDLEDTASDASTDIDTVTLMREYIDTLTINCDKDALFTYLQTKYQEAVSASQNARSPFGKTNSR
jgi:DNA repair exonuclease SbcCD nuclease subunit